MNASSKAKGRALSDRDRERVRALIFDLGEREAGAALGLTPSTAVRAALGLSLQGSTAAAIEAALARLHKS